MDMARASQGRRPNITVVPSSSTLFSLSSVSPSRKRKRVSVWGKTTFLGGNGGVGVVQHRFGGVHQLLEEHHVVGLGRCEQPELGELSEDLGRPFLLQYLLRHGSHLTV